jgi:hypothetical protein
MKTPAIIAQVEDYLVSRRAMGFDLRGEGYQLRAFARFAGEQADAETLTLEFVASLGARIRRAWACNGGPP